MREYTFTRADVDKYVRALTAETELRWELEDNAYAYKSHVSPSCWFSLECFNHIKKVVGASPKRQRLGGCKPHYEFEYGGACFCAFVPDEEVK